MGTSYQLNFRLQAGYSADPVNVKPLPGVWLDTKFDTNHDGNGGNADDVTVETNNENQQLVQDGPRGTQFGNATAAKAGASANGAVSCLRHSSSFVERRNPICKCDLNNRHIH